MSALITSSISLPMPYETQTDRAYNRTSHLEERRKMMQSGLTILMD